MKRTCGIFLCGLFLPLLPVTLFAQQMDIRDFVHQTFFEGMPYDAANAYTAGIAILGHPPVLGTKRFTADVGTTKIHPNVRAVIDAESFPPRRAQALRREIVFLLAR